MSQARALLDASLTVLEADYPNTVHVSWPCNRRSIACPTGGMRVALAAIRGYKLLIVATLQRLRAATCRDAPTTPSGGADPAHGLVRRLMAAPPADRPVSSVLRFAGYDPVPSLKWKDAFFSRSSCRSWFGTGYQALVVKPERLPHAVATARTCVELVGRNNLADTAGAAEVPAPALSAQRTRQPPNPLSRRQRRSRKSRDAAERDVRIETADVIASFTNRGGAAQAAGG